MPLDVVAVLDDLAIERSSFFGHSMGGGVGLALAHYAPDRFSALGFAASAPDSERSEAAGGLLALLEQGPAALLAAWRASVQLSTGMTERLLAIDCRALTALLQAPRARPETDANALARFPGRYRFFVGENDWFYADMIAALDRLEPGSLVTYPNLNHLESFRRADLVVADVRAFFADGRRPAGP